MTVVEAENLAVTHGIAAELFEKERDAMFAAVVAEFFAPLNYLFAPGSTGKRVTPWHFPFPVLLPISRPDASRRVAVAEADEPLLVTSLPVRRLEASRNWVRLPPPANFVDFALPVRRPL